ncbi:uncharacterized protein LOC132719571 [Ruditapes philippinarum]|uniref:uncharacterized protein LOC132719571 n=1 Tax=Ruditapes philippinarum TaxID=129788 RepID=UPI00295B5808|nr:uncharacterized protein LOC132719571 [Ruditapes philippinarum]XP_060559334.1 uncharacterized protein LOC132719571 [Ruditapes philippinarum]XP_060559335.1 uncharacterized protein LOC132719571 [Ruditapes philippinarum]
MDLKSGLNPILWIFILPNIFEARDEDPEGIDIGYSCKYDAECKKGNGEMFSKCNQALNICICTINHLGEDKCMPDSGKYEGFCRPRSLYSKPGFCTLECSPKGTMKWTNRDWYGIILDPFSSYIHDKKVCYKNNH